MKLTIAPGPLAAAVAWAARTLPTRPSIPVLAGLLVEADASGKVTVSAFNYDVSVTTTIDADTISEPGKILLPGRLLAEVTKALPDRTITELVAGDSECAITCGSTEYNLQTLPVDDYPTLPTPPASVGTVDGNAFAHAVEQVHTACGRDDTLPMLTGIRADTDGDRLTLAATDRYRIAVTDLPWAPDGGQTVGAVIPGRALHDIAKGADGPVTLAVDDKLAAITTPNRQTTIRLLDNQFIDYRARVQVDAAVTATIDPQALATAVKRVALVADRKSAGIRLSFAADHVRVQAGGDDIGRGGDTAPCTLKGDAIDIAFQSGYLLDALAAVDGKAAIRMTGPVKPALFVSEDGSHKQLVMSLRLA